MKKDTKKRFDAQTRLFANAPEGYESEWFETIKDIETWTVGHVLMGVYEGFGKELIPTFIITKTGFGAGEDVIEDDGRDLFDPILEAVYCARFLNEDPDRLDPDVFNPQIDACSAVVFIYEKGQLVYPLSGESFFWVVEALTGFFDLGQDIVQTAEKMFLDANYLLAS